VLSGYLGDPGTAAAIADAVARVRAANPAAVYCCDPVIGEVGRGVYVRAGIPDAFRERLVALADIVTPNPFELELLSGIGPSTLAPDELAVIAVTRGPSWLVRHPRRDVRVWGTGDAFAALFLGAYLGRREPGAALEHAVAALDDVLTLAQSEDSDELPLVAALDALVRPRAQYRAERLA
jgi:pyridoxine kinase